MHRRPRLKEAVQLLEQLSQISPEAAQAIEEYNELLVKGYEFAAAHLVVEIVDHYYHLNNVQECVNG
jgi:predicted nuclease of restriction endonuclease-like RecB superfamily